jgi:hypothetical protein
VLSEVEKQAQRRRLDLDRLPAAPQLAAPEVELELVERESLVRVAHARASGGHPAFILSPRAFIECRENRGACGAVAGSEPDACRGAVAMPPLFSAVRAERASPLRASGAEGQRNSV